MVESAKHVADAPHRRTILMVDDDDVLLMVMHMVFERNGFNVINADNGLAGLSAIREKTPDIIITDLMMPVMDGLTFIAAVRKTEGTAAIPIIAISAMKGDELPKKAMEAGANQFCIKPFSPESLLTVIKNQLSASIAP